MLRETLSFCVLSVVCRLLASDSVRKRFTVTDRQIDTMPDISLLMCWFQHILTYHQLLAVGNLAWRSVSTCS